ncbi:DedA family protein [Propionibacterium freudenreichii]|uniref:DedA family protein n=1 Tax=Propionibacterium freudenreichii TaxID=1744 RepID=UPI000BC2E9B3|nr:DedA family protein [Propionibacterium freudenreichii]MDK9295773.1 DedA family protein [Propionibacterium freudenreichii]MDK9361165.1 DedA family protein [Propionibacterium freudenreichii]MDK9640448.1 DedA family protein [Propionibacterium freudenreichii]MDK9660148.1 DedA family protein [Propionibacterium freudenreichii]WGU91467.1 DedA family protein [Propionibacterium freudenreichii]
MDLSGFFFGLPAGWAYVLVGLVVGLESLGVPLPGETILISVVLLTHHPDAGFSAWGIEIAASVGAIIGDSIGYTLGRRLGPRLFGWLGRRFPAQASAVRLAYAEHLINRFGVTAVFFGRFIALLRMFAGPLAGSLRMSYRRFLIANICGAVAWAGGTTALMWALGSVASHWMSRVGWILLVAVILVGLVVGRVSGSALSAKARDWARDHPDEVARATGARDIPDATGPTGERQQQGPTGGAASKKVARGNPVRCNELPGHEPHRATQADRVATRADWWGPVLTG